MTYLQENAYTCWRVLNDDVTLKWMIQVQRKSRIDNAYFG